MSRYCLDTDGTLDYSKLIPYLTDNRERNELIIKDLEQNREHSNLILSDRLEHLHTLMEGLPAEQRVQVYDNTEKGLCSCHAEHWPDCPGV